MIDHNGYIKIHDYENAKFLPANTKSRKIVGYIEYLAPEVI